jgi:hypothetical protein
VTEFVSRPVSNDGNLEMITHDQWLLKHAFNKFSQTGEDGVVAKILSLIPERDSWCVEFGAWDGIHLSNVRNLILGSRYQAILIEGNVTKFNELKGNYTKFAGVSTINAFVGFDAATGLDRILLTTKIPRKFDFLSIDIDGNDYHVWHAVKEYRPKVVCIEFNPTIPTEVAFVQSANSQINHGSSLLALDQLARAKGYELVCVLPWNAFFVDQQYFSELGITDNRPEVLRQDLSAITWLFSGYDGTMFLSGSRKLPWHDVSIDERRLQVLPKILRSYPGEYSRCKNRLLRLLKSLKVV